MIHIETDDFQEFQEFDYLDELTMDDIEILDLD